MSAKPIFFFCLALGLSGGLFGCATPNGQPTPAGAGANQHFAEYLNRCADNEVRCLWFLQDDPRIGMVMTMNLKGKTVTMARDVYDWAEQDLQTRKLDEDQVSEIQKIISQMPPSDKHSEYGCTVFISTRDGGATNAFQYDRHYPPAVVRHLYNLAGGYFYADEDD